MPTFDVSVSLADCEDEIEAESIDKAIQKAKNEDYSSRYVIGIEAEDPETGRRKTWHL